MAKTVQKKGSRINLNLLYPQGLNQKIPIRFIKWLLSYGRFIVIVVEVIVLGAWGYRFKLDNDLTRINEQINEKVPFVESLSQDEAVLKQAQQRISIIRTTYASIPSWDTVLSKINLQIPISTRLNNLNILKNDRSILQFKLVAETNNIGDVSSFQKNLKSVEELRSISLTSISFEQGVIVFSITGEIK